MAGNTDLTITIKAQVGAAITEVNKLRELLESLVTDIPKGVSASTANADPLKPVVEGLEKGKQAIKKTQDEIIRDIQRFNARHVELINEFSMAEAAGATRQTEQLIRFMKANNIAHTRALSGVEGGGTIDQYRNVEDMASEVANLTRSQALLQLAAEKANAAFTAQSKEVSQGFLGAYHAGEDYPGLGLLKKDLKLIDQEFKNNQKSAQALIKTVEQLSSVYSDASKGAAVIRRTASGGEFKTSAAELTSYQKELQIAIKRDALMRKQIAEGGVNLYKGPKSAEGAYIDKEMKAWADKKPGFTVYSEEEKQKVLEWAKAQGIAAKSTNWIKGYAEDVKNMMSMQARWFTSAGIIFAVSGTVYSTIRAFFEFDKALKEIQAVTGITNEELKILSDRAIQVSVATPHSTTEIAKLSRMLIQAGLSAGQTSGILMDVAKVATVSGSSLESVGKAYTTAMFAWGMSTKESEKIGNILAATLNYSRLQIDDLATAYNYVAASASQFNLSFEETNAALAVFSNMGIRASTSATGFTKILIRLADPPVEFRKAIEKSMGSYNDLLKIFESDSPDKFAQIIEKVGAAGINGSGALRMFGTIAGKEMAAALNAGAPAFYQMNERLRSTQQLTNGFKTAMSSFSNQMSTAWNKIQAAFLGLGNVLTPVIQGVVSSLQVLAKLIFYMAKGVEVFGSAWVPVVFGIGLATTLFLKFGKAVLTVDAIVAASKNIFKTHPLFAAAMITGTVISTILAVIGYFKATSADMEQFTKAQADLQAGAEAFGEQQKKVNQIINEGAGGVRSLKERMAEAVTEFNLARNMPFTNELIRLQVSATAAVVAIDRLKKNMEDLFKEQPKLEAEFEKASQQIERSLAPGGSGAGFGALSREYIKSKEALEANRKDAEADAKKLAEVRVIAEKDFAELYKKLNTGKAVAEALSAAMISASMSEGEKINIQMAGLNKQLGEQQAAFRKAQEKAAVILSNPLSSDADKDKVLGKVAAVKLNLEELQTAAEALSSSKLNLQKKWDDMAVSAENAMQSARDALKSYKFDIAELESNDPFRKIFLRGQVEADGLAKKMREVRSEISEIRKEMAKDSNLDRKGALASSLAKKEAELEFLTKQKGLVPKHTAAEVALKTEEIKLKILELENQAQGYFIDKKKEELGIAVQLGKMSLAEAAHKKMEFEKEAVANELKLLQVQLASANAYNDEQKQLEIINKIRQVIFRQEVNEQQYLIDQNKGRIDEKIAMSDAESMYFGKNTAQQKALLEIEKQIVAARAAGGLSREQADAALERQRYLLTDIGTALGDLGKAGENFIEGFRSVGTEFKGIMLSMRNFGKSMADSIATSFGDAFYKMSTMEGFDKSKYKNYWEFVKDMADEFLRTIYQNFMRTLADMYTAWLKTLMRDMVLKWLAGSNVGTGTEVDAGESLMTTGKRHSGGLILHQGGYIPRYHSGALSPDERVAILQTGEGVLSRRGMANLGALNSGSSVNGGGEKSVVNNFVIQAADAKSFSDMVKRNPGAIVGAVTQDLRFAGGSRSAMRKYL